MAEEKKKKRTGLWITVGVLGTAALAAYDAKHGFKIAGGLGNGWKKVGNGLANGMDALIDSFKKKGDAAPEPEQRTFSKNDNWKGDGRK